MTITAYEINATLAIVDRATPQLEKVLALSKALTAEFEKIKALSGGLFNGMGGKRVAASLGGLDKEMSKITAEAAKMQAAAVASVDSINLSMLKGTEAARAMRAEMTEAAAVAKAAGFGVLPGTGGAGGGKGGGGAQGGSHSAGGTHIGGNVPVAPGAHASVRLGPTLGGAGMASLAALGYGAYEEAVLRDTIAKILFTSGVPLTGAGHEQDFAAVRKILFEASTSTGAPIHEIQDAALGLTRQMAGFALKDRLAIYRTALEFGVQEHMLKGASVEEGTEALIGLLHQTGTYDPGKINQMASNMAYMSLVSPLTLSQIARASSYAMPLVSQGLNIDKDELLLTMAAMQRAGVLSSKSGTWVNQGLTREFVETATISGHAAEKQREALKSLGLIDADGKSTVIDAKGHLSIIGLAQQLQKAKAQFEKDYGGLAGAHLVAAENQAFGVQGGRFIGMLSTPQMVEQLPGLMASMKRMPDAQQYFRDMFEASPAQQGRTALADFNKELMDVAAHAFPFASWALQTLDSVLKAADGMEDMGKAAVVGGSILAPFAGWFGFKKLLGLLGSGKDALLETSGAKAAMEAGKAGLSRAGVGLLAAGRILSPFAAFVGAVNGGSLNEGEDAWLSLHKNDLGVANGAGFRADMAARRAANEQPPLSAGDLQSIARMVGDQLAAKLDGASVKMDGREVGNLVIDRMSKEGSRPPSTTSGLDWRLSPAYPTGGGF